VELFAEWLDVAVEWGVPEPVAATLATVDDEGIPDARTLILKSVDARGWAFAGTATSRKGEQLAACSSAALNLWWQPLVRAVRVRGPVVEASSQECEADLAARSKAARDGVDPRNWRLWRLVPSRVEFWQGSPDRQHQRIVYTYDRGWHLRM
jgi:pyridoxamine 5'-phosphate oxidase